MTQPFIDNPRPELKQRARQVFSGLTLTALTLFAGYEVFAGLSSGEQSADTQPDTKSDQEPNRTRLAPRLELPTENDATLFYTGLGLGAVVCAVAGGLYILDERGIEESNKEPSQEN